MIGTSVGIEVKSFIPLPLLCNADDLAYISACAYHFFLLRLLVF